MIKLIISCIVLGLLTILISCSNEQKKSIVYIGAYRSLDQVIPYPYIFSKQYDSVFLYNNEGALLGSVKHKYIKLNDTLKLGEKLLLIDYFDENYLHAFDLNDRNKFRVENGHPDKKSKAKFKRLKTRNKLNLTNIKNRIVHGIWRFETKVKDNSIPNSDLIKEELLRFESDSICRLTNYYYQGVKIAMEHLKSSYTVFQISNYTFLSLGEEEDNPQPILQIIRSDLNTIELIDFSSRKAKSVKLIEENVDIKFYLEMIKNSSLYSNCFDGYFGEYYYGDDVTYAKGNEFILDRVRSGAPRSKGNSGYVVVHFKINCEGNMGNYGLLQMNEKFETSGFSIELVRHIFNKVKNLKDWTFRYSNVESLPYKDVHAFLMFKIENGEITDILP